MHLSSKNLLLSETTPIFILVAAYLIWGTGLASDDFTHLLYGVTRPLSNNLLPSTYLSTPLLHYTHELAYYIFGREHLIAYDILKWVYVSLTIVAAARFFSLFTSKQSALLIGFLFAFYPLHDAATFWLTGLYLQLGFSLYFLAYYFVNTDRLRTAFLFALAGSFASYGSPPIAIGLSMLMAHTRGIKRAAILFIPNALYIAYYLLLNAYILQGSGKLTSNTGIGVFAKQFLLQVASLIDAAFGPSFWLKIHASLSELELASWLVGIATCMLVYKLLPSQREALPKPVLYSLGLILTLALAMFALTGHYPQIALNLGNRVTIYASLLLAFCIIQLPLPRWAVATIAGICLLGSFGLADHWKKNNQFVLETGQNIRASHTLTTLPETATLLVAGGAYSQLGAFSHIEFLATDDTLNSFLSLQLGEYKRYPAIALRPYMQYRDGVLYDPKFDRTFSTTAPLWLYELPHKKLTRLQPDEVETIIVNLKEPARHWTQLLGEGPLRDTILYLMPRLKYAY